MSERACGIHALDAAPNDACPHCTRARIQARDEEIERLTAAWHAEMELSAKFQQELAAVRAAATWMFWRLSSWDGREALTQWPWLAEKAGGGE